MGGFLNWPNLSHFKRTVFVLSHGGGERESGSLHLVRFSMNFLCFPLTRPEESREVGGFSSLRDSQLRSHVII